MSYIYDVYVNFQILCYDFYEWSKNDKILHIKKIPIFKIEEDKMQKIIKNSNKTDLQFLTLIRDKTEIYNCGTKKNACLFTDGKTVIAVQLNKNGVIIKKSFMLLEEECDILEIASRFPLKEIVIEELQVNPKIFLTRFEAERKNFVLRNISKIDDQKICYLYFECFNSEEKNRQLSEGKLKREIYDNNERICSISYSFLKLIHANT